MMKDHTPFTLKPGNGTLPVKQEEQGTKANEPPRTTKSSPPHREGKTEPRVGKGLSPFGSTVEE